MKMFKSLPKRARTELVFNFAVSPMNLNVCYNEIKHDTKLGKEILYLLGYEND